MGASPVAGIHLPDPLVSDQVMHNLQTLRGVVNLKLSEEVCERIPNIKDLYLKYRDSEFEPLRSSSYYCLHNLGRFHKLESLDFSLFDNTSKWPCEGGLRFELPSTLKKLRLDGCHLDSEEIIRMGGSLPRLECLYLENISFIGSEWTLVEEKFPRLKSLRISYCDDLACWNADSSSFPVLEHLDIGGLWKLDEIPLGMGEIPTLQSISLSNCSEGLMISVARMVMEIQEEHGNEDLELVMGSLLGVDYPSEYQEERFKKKLEEEGISVSNLLLYYW